MPVHIDCKIDRIYDHLEDNLCLSVIEFKNLEGGEATLNIVITVL